MPPIHTIGHSTRPIEEFIELLRANAVRLLVDVRRFPGSRRLPQYNRESLADALRDAGIDYRHEEALGGRRAPNSQGPSYWRNRGFRGYADHMLSDEFDAGVGRLLDETLPLAVMCAEAVPWRCHRNLLSDALTLRGAVVRHIIGPAAPAVHEPPPEAGLDEHGRVRYAAPAGEAHVQTTLDL